MMDRDAKRRWALFEQWENEVLAEQLPRISPHRCWEQADDLYRLALAVSPQTIRVRPVEEADWLASDDLQAAMRLRTIFDRLADKLRS